MATKRWKSVDAQIAFQKEKEAKEKGIQYKVGTFPFAASGKAIATNETEAGRFRNRRIEFVRVK